VQGGLDPNSRWLILTYVLYLIAGACWVPAVFIQLRIRNMLASKVAGGQFDQNAYRRLRRWWFALGWPAFLALIFIIHLMVTKPS
jgi:uncharacterized membrane protein